MSKVLGCELCTEWIEKWGSDKFNYTDAGEGPYCDKCWVWQSQIEELKKRVITLEGKPMTAAELRVSFNERKKTSPYDAGAKRVRSCPHHPKWRDCRC